MITTKRTDLLRAQEAAWIHAHPLRSAIKHARTRARAKGLSFTIKETDLTIPAVCPVFGIPLSKLLDRDHWPSLERVDNCKGYDPGNVIIISYKANRSKSNLSVLEMQKLARFYTDLLGVDMFGCISLAVYQKDQT